MSQLSKQQPTTLAGPKVYRQLFLTPSAPSLTQMASTLPSGLSSVHSCQEMLFVSRKPPHSPPPPPPCFTSNIFLNHLRGKTHRFVRRCRRFIAFLPQCGAGAFIPLSAPPCLSQFQPFSPPAAVRTPPQAIWHQRRKASPGARGH